MSDLFAQNNTPITTNKNSNPQDYSAKDIEVLEGLEPVRKRPGMYIGGTDERAYHHLASEVLDNAMDEAMAGFATKIEFKVIGPHTVEISDNGRGIPIDPHPKFPDKSALEVIMTTLHSGGKFSNTAYKISGGLHGVGLSVVNALSEEVIIEVARTDREVYQQTYQRGLALTSLARATSNLRKGTRVRLTPDPKIFGTQIKFQPTRLFKMAQSKAYLYKGVTLVWSCEPHLLSTEHNIPETAILHFPGGLHDYLTTRLKPEEALSDIFSGESSFNGEREGKLEWAIAWEQNDHAFIHSYVNTIPTPEGGSHEIGVKNALLRSLKAYAEMIGLKRAQNLTNDDMLSGAKILLSLFVAEPQFQGQTKEKLSMNEMIRATDAAIKDYFDHWLVGNPNQAKMLLEYMVNRADERLRLKQSRALARVSATQKLRLPGKLADCSNTQQEDTEIFIVEGDSAGGSAKQARDRKTQAILPLRGKILNVASASQEKFLANQELKDLILALGCGTRKEYMDHKLRYEKVIIMTDADVDGAHIASLLLTFFWSEMPELIRQGHLYLAQPPLYKLTSGQLSHYARDDAHKDVLMNTVFKGKSKIEISRFKGLGEMPPSQLKETTMNKDSRILLQVRVPDMIEEAEDNQALITLVHTLMGKKAELRFEYIQQNARFVEEVDI